jgi:CubicO group peptidase (beta-lactamase class C family)
VIASPFFTNMKTFLPLLLASQLVQATPPEIGNALEDFLKTTKVRGASVLWIKYGETSTWQYGNANAKGDVPITVETRFRAGSLSKLATAVIALRAEEAGKLSLDDRLDKWLPGILSAPYDWKEKVTLAQLLEHTAGLSGSTYAEYATNAPGLSPTEYVRRNSPFKLRWEPGMHYSYANSGATILGAVLEKAYSLSFDEIASKELFVPLGMSQSDFSNQAVNLSACFDAEGKEIPTLWEMPVRPAGSLVSTPQDLGKLMRVLLARGKLPDGSEFLSPASVARMETAATSIAAKHGATAGAYGLGNFGFVQDGIVFRGHWGRTDGFQTNFGYNPDQNCGFILMVNSADRGATHGLRKILRQALVTSKPDIKAQPVGNLSPPPEGIYVNYSHDMPMRAWLFALLETKRISASNKGITSTPLIAGGATQAWTEVAANLYQADCVPVATGTFHNANGKQFWVDGESFVRRNYVLVYGEIGLLLLAAIAALLSPFAAVWHVRSHRIPAIALLASGASMIALPSLFWFSGLTGMGNELGKISPASLGLLVASVLLPVGAVIAVFKPRSPRALRLIAVPLLAVSLLLTIRGWMPLITF